MGVERINKKSFMAELRSLLSFLDPEDKARALRRYELMFEQVGEDGEEALLRKLGSPIRQVLEVEQEYRKAHAQGKVLYAEEMPVTVAEDAEMIPAASEEPPADLGQSIMDAAEKLEKRYQGDRPEAGTKPEKVEEDLFPIADMSFSDSLFPAEETGAEAPSVEENSFRLDESDEAWHQALAPAGTPDGDEAIPYAEEDEEVERIIRFAEETEKKPEKNSGQPEDTSSDKPGAGRVLAAILVTVPVLLMWAIGLVLFLTLGFAVLAAGFVLCAVGVYIGSYAFNGLVTFMPDMLLVCGGALGCFALALFFLWMGLWIAVGGLILLGRATAGIYRGILKKRAPREDEDDE